MIQMLDDLANFSSEAGCRILVVLDGKGDLNELAGKTTPSFQAVYSGPVSADAFIEKMLVEDKSESRWVVTNDRAITSIARGAGARVIKSEEFCELLSSNVKNREETLWKERVRSHGFSRPFEGKL